MTLPAMLDDLPTDCDVGMKKDTQGLQVDLGRLQELHLDVADGQIPISCLLTSASLHDSQADDSAGDLVAASERPICMT